MRLDTLGNEGKPMSASDTPELLTELIHLRHFYDGYPLCWPMNKEGDFQGTRDETQITCPACKKIIEGWKEDQ